MAYSYPYRLSYIAPQATPFLIPQTTHILVDLSGNGEVSDFEDGGAL